MNRNTSRNPMLNERVMSQATMTKDGSAQGTMTIGGSIGKTFVLLLILIASAFVSWRVGLDPKLAYLAKPILIGGGVIGLVLVMVASFKPQYSPVVGPFYAMVEGLFVGVLSAIYAAQMDGIVLQAVMLTIFVLLGMLGLYYFRIIKVTDRLRSIIVSATVGVFLTYLISFVLGFFDIHVPFIHSGGWFGIGFSLFVVGLAAFNLLLDFDFIERGAQGGMPKYGEWFAAIGLLVTLVWLYIELLRLLSKLNRD